MYKIVKKSEGIVRRVSDKKIVTNIITKETSKNLSLVTTEAINHFEKVNLIYNRVYFILKGEMILKFKSDEHKLHEGDACFIAKGTEYEMLGTYKAVIVNQPAHGT